jgi:exonuclease III
VAKFSPPKVPFIAARHHGGNQTPKAIVIHGTVSSDNRGTARQIAAWWHGPTSPVTSAHYIVDPAEVIQAVGDHTVAFHCGYNTGSISLELCDEQAGPATRWDDADSNAILKNAAHTTAQLCLAYGIEVRRPSVTELRSKGPHGIYGHNDSRLAFGNTTHSDPKDFPWAKFLALVAGEVAVFKGFAKPVKAKPKPSKPSKTGLELVVATNNVMSLPKNPEIHDTLLAATGTPTVVGLQELDPASFKQAARNIKGWGLTPIDDDVTYAEAVLWDKAVWEPIGRRYVKQYDGVRKISYTRHFCVTRLRHRELGFEVVFISYHAVTKGNDPERRRMRAEGLTALRDEISKARARGVVVVVAGDYNATSTQHPTATVKIKHDIDHIYAWSGKDVKVTKVASRTVATRSDHDVLIARLGLTLKG